MLEYRYTHYIECEFCGQSTRGPISYNGDVKCDSCNRVLSAQRGSEEWKEQKIVALQKTELLNKKNQIKQLEKEISRLEEMISCSDREPTESSPAPLPLKI